MSRSGYTDDCEGLALGRWRGRVASAIRGRRGQAFLRELAAAMDAMPEKVLIAGELIASDWGCCTIGVVCEARKIDVAGVDIAEADRVAEMVGIAEVLVREIEYENDEGGPWDEESPADRWVRMRKWVARHLKPVE